MRKFLLTFVAIIASCMAMAASIAENEVDYSYLRGTYTTSAYPNTYELLEENGFPKRACTIGVQMKALPYGYHYSWKILKGNGDEDLQVQPGTNFAYIGQNGHTDVFEFSISIIDETTGHPIMSRDIRFVFIEGFNKPIVPPVGY